MRRARTRPKVQQERLSKRPVRTSGLSSERTNHCFPVYCTVYTVGLNRASPAQPPGGRDTGMSMPGCCLGDGACCDAWASLELLYISNHPASSCLNTWDTRACSTPSSVKCLKVHHKRHQVYQSDLAPAGARECHYAVTHTFFLAMGRPRGLS